MTGPLDDPRFIVMVADDDTLVRFMISEMLADANYEVVEARDGQEALAILGSQVGIGALLTDVTMPNVDGLALAKIARQRWPHIGVVVTSGRQVPSGLPDGTRFISKPFSQEKLLHELKSVIAETIARQASTARR
jgi:CheY-like chemotaxis protein